MVELGNAEGGDEARHLLRRVAVGASRHETEASLLELSLNLEPLVRVQRATLHQQNVASEGPRHWG